MNSSSAEDAPEEMLAALTAFLAPSRHAAARHPRRYDDPALAGDAIEPELRRFAR
jgi:hypothetical protein